MIYFVEAVGADRVKIGWVADSGIVAVQKRIKTLQTGCPYPLEIRHTIPGDVAAEHTLHNRFKHLNVGGEWFTFNEEIKHFIEETSRPQSKSYPYRCLRCKFPIAERCLCSACAHMWIQEQKGFVEAIVTNLFKSGVIQRTV